jgi:hypothetical protein
MLGAIIGITDRRPLGIHKGSPEQPQRLLLEGSKIGHHEEPEGVLGLPTRGQSWQEGPKSATVRNP